MPIQNRFHSAFWLLVFSTAVLYFSSCQCDADALTDNTWVLEQYGPKGSLTDVMAAGTPPGTGIITINFDDTDDKVNGNDGCNTYLGTYEQEKCDLSVAGLQSTLILCTDQAVMTQASAYMQILQDVTSFSTKNNRLRLCTDDNRELHYRKQ